MKYGFRGKVTKYNIDVDDYKVKLLRGIQLIREQMKEHADSYRRTMGKYYNSRHEGGAEKLPKVGERVFMRLPSGKTKNRNPKFTFKWDGSFRVLEVYSTPALILRIRFNEEPLKIQMDLLWDYGFVPMK